MYVLTKLEEVEVVEDLEKETDELVLEEKIAPFENVAKALKEAKDLVKVEKKKEVKVPEVKKRVEVKVV